MTFDREEFDAFLAKQKGVKLDQYVPSLTLLRQAAPPMETLTGLPTWDLFLNYLQGAIEKTREQLRTLDQQMRSSDVLSHEAMLQCKIQIIRCEERIAAWDAVVGLPKELVEHGTAAQGLLERMNGDGSRQADAEDGGPGRQGRGSRKPKRRGSKSAPAV